MSDEEILNEAIKNSKMKRFLKFENLNNDQNSKNSNDNNNEKEIINKRFNELRKKHKNLSVDSEAEEHIQNLRNIGEYNRWSLKLIQKYLTIFYQGKKIVIKIT